MGGCFSGLSTAALPPNPQAFLKNKDAKARIFTDLKLDDLAALWYFIVLNLQRPADHQVDIQICVVGLKEFRPAVRLAHDICYYAKKYASDELGPQDKPLVTWNIFASKHLHDAGPRHEEATYEPYRHATPSWSHADLEEPRTWQQEIDPHADRADLIWVLGQFFNWECRDITSKDFKFVANYKSEQLPYLVPRSGGLLCFQYGFNIGLRKGSLEQYKDLWLSNKLYSMGLCAQVKAANAQILVVSNLFSFKDSQKPEFAADHPFLTQLTALDGGEGEVWKHLMDAAQKESLLFACDQMAKWLTDTDLVLPDGVSLHDSGAKKEVDAFRAENGIPVLAKAPMTNWLRDEFWKEERLQRRTSKRRAAGTENRVFAWCRNLLALVKVHYDELTTDYLDRAVKAFRRYIEGNSVVEVTDAVQMLAAMQDRVDVIKPAMFVEDENSKTLSVQAAFAHNHHDRVLWLVWSVPAALAKELMSELQDFSMTNKYFSAIPKR